MKLRVLFSICALALLFSMSMHAADITGKWTASQEGRDGTPRVTTFTFKQAGTALTGTIMAPGRGGQAGMERPIADGKVDGDTVTFTISQQGRDGAEQKITYTGKIANNEITFTRSGGGGGGGRGGNAMPLVAKKAS
jgi:hypothetical protein